MSVLCPRAVVAVLLGSVLFATEPAKSAEIYGLVSHIRREPVQSSAIAAIGYSKRLRALEIEFMNGAIYRYLDVPDALYRELRSASSKAHFYDDHVRGKYRSLHVRPRIDR